jgi:hypothetical protein
MFNPTKSIMKNLFFTLSIMLYSKVYSQTYISQTYMTAVSYSIKISYYNSSYSYAKPYASASHYAQATLQARYDYNHQWCSNEYWRVKDLTLVNETNIATLNGYKNIRLPWVYNAIKTWNLGIDQNAKKIINYCTEIFNYGVIKDEIAILSAINLEIQRLKNNLPGEFHLSKRYLEIANVLSELNSCSPAQISALAWEHGLI